MALPENAMAVLYNHHSIQKWNQPEGIFEINLCHESILTEVINNGKCMIYRTA